LKLAAWKLALEVQFAGERAAGIERPPPVDGRFIQETRREFPEYCCGNPTRSSNP